MNRDLEGLRRDYQAGQLLEEHAGDDPIALFEVWLSDAKKTTQLEPNAMTLATIDGMGNPHARIVLLKGQDGRDFKFYTNYLSHKGEELLASPSAALVFWWDQLERQVRVEGTVEKLSDEENDAYFQERPKGSRLGAWASQQSQVIDSHRVLTEKMSELEAQYPGEVPRPQHWGGYAVRATRIEFWQGRSSPRLSIRWSELESSASFPIVCCNAENGMLR